jgi:hypothetical protein
MKFRPLILFLFFTLCIMVTCSVCGVKFDTPRGLSNHNRGKCGQKQGTSIAAVIEKRRQDRNKQLAAKVRRVEDEGAVLREREAIREESAEATGTDNEIPVRLSIQLEPEL